MDTRYGLDAAKIGRSTSGPSGPASRREQSCRVSPRLRPRRAVAPVICLLVASCALTALSGEGATGACTRSPFLHVEAGRIVDGAGREVVLHGVNLSNANKFPNEGGSFIPSWIGEGTFESIAAAGLDSVRFLMVWEAIEPSPGTIDEAYLDWVAEMVRMAGAAGLHVILDMHQDLYARKLGGDGAPEWAVLDGGIPFEPNPIWFLNYLHPAVVLSLDNFWSDAEGIQTHFREAWAAVARRFKDEQAVAGYDLQNEPFGGSLFLFPDRFDREWLIPFTEALTARIREEDPNHIIFFEPGAMRTNVLAPAGFPSAFLAAPDPSSVLAPHLYDPLVTLTHVWDGGRERITSEVSQVASEAARLKAGLWVGEWSVWEYSVEGGEDYLDAELDAMDSSRASWSFWEWNDSDSRSPFTPGSENAWMAERLDRPYPRKTAGTISTIAYDDLTGELVLEYRPRSGETEIYLPSRIYGDSPAVEAPAGAAASFDPSRRILTIGSVTGSLARVRVTPGLT